MENPSLTILTNDPSITAWGWAVIRDNKVLAAGCIQTSSQQKARRIRKGDDTVRRVSEINTELLQIIHKYSVNYLLSELPHGSQSASAAVMIGICTGVMQTISDALGIGIEWYSEADAKKAISGSRSVSKQAMIEAVKKKYDVSWVSAKFRNEAIADAVAVYHCARQQSPILKVHSGVLKSSSHFKPF